MFKWHVEMSSKAKLKWNLLGGLAGLGSSRQDTCWGASGAMRPGRSVSFPVCPVGSQESWDLRTRASLAACGPGAWGAHPRYLGHCLAPFVQRAGESHLVVVLLQGDV